MPFFVINLRHFTPMESTDDITLQQAADTWIPYQGRSRDQCYTFIQEKKAQSKSTKALFRCRICLSVNAIGNGPSNVKRHLQLKHNIEAGEITYSEWVSNGKSKRSMHTSSPFHKFSCANSTSQTVYVTHCAEWIARDNRPLSVVEDIGFRNILRHIAPRIKNVSRQTVLRRLKTMEEKIAKDDSK